MSIYTYTRAGGGARVHAAVPSTLNFQARLLQANGAIVADGTYSISFNLYTAESGGSAVWNEVHGTVQVRSGYLSVYLGSVDNDLDTLDWSQQYWLTMNVNSDGEMNPRLKLTSVPYAFRSGQTDTLTNGASTLSASDLVQLSPSSIQAVNTALAALRINQTGSGLLAQLQGDGADVFTVSKTGDVTASGSLDIGAALSAGAGNAFQVNTSGDITATFTLLNGSSTADGGTVLASTSLTLINATDFDVGNYVQISSTDCGGSGVNVCYAKITAKTTNTLTISPSLTWASGSTVIEYHVPELGATNTSSTLANRYGRGYFISGVATGNGTTYYNEDSVESSLSTFNLLNTNVTTLNIGGSATTLNLGSSSGAVNIIGDLATNGSSTVTAGGGLIVSNGGADITGNSVITGTLQTSSTLTVAAGGVVVSGGIDNNSGGITEAGAVSGATTLSLSGAITGATTTNTINGLVVNGGALSSVAGITFASGSLNLSSGGITNTGSLAGVTTLNASGLVTGGAGLTITGAAVNLNASSNFAVNIATGTTTGTVTIGGGSAPLAINSTAFDVSSAGALSGITTLNMSGAITAATSTNTINGLIINSGALSGITTLTASGNISISSTSVYRQNGLNGLSIATCANNQYIGNGVRVSGGIITNGSCRDDANTLSDIRLKENIVEVGSTVDKLKGVSIYTYDFRCHDPQFKELYLNCNRQTGVIAQELEQVFPELVHTRDDGYKEVNIQALSFYNIKAVGELANRLDNLERSSQEDVVVTGGVVRLDAEGVLQNITGFQMLSGGASVAGGIDNNYGGLTEVGDISGATLITAQKIVLNASSTDHLLELRKDSSGVFTVFNNGALELKLDSYQSLSVKDAQGTSIFTIDTINGQIRIGNGNPSKTVLLTLDSRDVVDDPPGTNGSSYYNTKLKRFRCYQDDRWTDCLPVGTLNDPITLSRTVWNGMPSAETEFPGEPRILPNLTRAHEFKLRLRITAPGAESATCRLQFAASDNGPWEDLMDGGSGELSISKAGTVTTEWLKLKEAARDEVVLRVMCKGGNGSASPVFYGVSVQLR